MERWRLRPKYHPSPQSSSTEVNSPSSLPPLFSRSEVSTVLRHFGEKGETKNKRQKESWEFSERSTWLAQLVKCLTFSLTLVSLSPMLGVLSPSFQKQKQKNHKRKKEKKKKKNSLRESHMFWPWYALKHMSNSLKVHFKLYYNLLSIVITYIKKIQLIIPVTLLLCLEIAFQTLLHVCMAGGYGGIDCWS